MSWKPFVKKEVNEIFRTYKIYVIPAVFLFFGLLSPLTAKFMPQLMEQMLKSYGIQSQNIPEAVFSTAYEQFFKNISQLMFVVILVFAGMIVGEKVKGTAVLVLTKPVSRTQFVLSKFISAVSLFTMAYILAAGACVYYTYLLFPEFYTQGLLLSLFMLWVSGVFFISLALFASTVGKTFTLAAVTGIGGYLLVSAITILPYAGKYTPGVIADVGLKILKGERPMMDFAAPTLTSLALSILLLASSIAILKRQEI